MLLAERGKLRLTDRVSEHWPEFGRHGKNRITLEQLLLHTSGLIADNPVEDYRDGKAKALERICDLKLVAEPGERFTYSDVGYIVLGELVERISGWSLDEFAAKNIFEPLGMKETPFRPNDPLKRRCAPTEQREGRWMRGEVHDPRAYQLGGVAGHAGLFSTAHDLALFARMFLGGKSVLATSTLAQMTEPRKVPQGLRAYGWDVDTRYSSNRGELFPRGTSFGHTGFTGTSIWIDPVGQTAVIFLSNRVHPKSKGNINKLRGEVATLAALACRSCEVNGTSPSSGVPKSSSWMKPGDSTSIFVVGHTPALCPAGASVLSTACTGVNHTRWRFRCRSR
jgi:CubicO group peptidase (beta-lactamase class C family)